MKDQYLLAHDKGSAYLQGGGQQRCALITLTWLRQKQSIEQLRVTWERSLLSQFLLTQEGELSALTSPALWSTW